MAGLIGLDWGTSSLRAMLFDGDGRVLDTRHRPHGVRALPVGGFDAALRDIVDGWPQCPRLACGMVGARGGWREMPYLDLPADVRAVAASLGAVQAADGEPVHLVPGLRDPRRPDVMRGEETQILGALAAAPALGAEATLLLPGTHSKWVRLRDGRVVDFCTAMTGELFAVLLRHSILGAGIANAEGADTQQANAGQGGAASAEARAFQRGVEAARDSGAAGGLSRLFSIRASMLSGALEGRDVPGYLSGLLIGEEMRAAVAAGTFASSAPLRLIGDPALCARYRDALALFAIETAPETMDTAAQGLWWIAVNAGLVAPARQAMPRQAGAAS